MTVQCSTDPFQPAHKIKTTNYIIIAIVICSVIVTVVVCIITIIINNQCGFCLISILYYFQFHSLNFITNLERLLIFFFLSTKTKKKRRERERRKYCLTAACCDFGDFCLRFQQQNLLKCFITKTKNNEDCGLFGVARLLFHLLQSIIFSYIF